MLLDNAKSIYINNLSAKEVWYSGNKIWTPPVVVQSKCLTDTYTWAEINEISAAGTANDYFNVGDTAIVTSSTGKEYEMILVGIYIDVDTNNNPVLTFMHKYSALSWYSGSSSGFISYTNSNCQPGSVAKNLANTWNTATGGILKNKNVGYYSSSTASKPSTTSLKGWVISIGEINNTGEGVANGIYYPYLYDHAVEVFGSVEDSNDFWTRETNGTYSVYWAGMNNQNKMIKVTTNSRSLSKNVCILFVV